MRDLENEALTKAKARAEELCGTEMNYFGITKNEIIAVQSNLRFGEKYVEMYSILKVLDEYLKLSSTDGAAERQSLRNKLKEMLEVL